MLLRDCEVLLYSTKWSGCGDSATCVQESKRPADCSADQPFRSVINSVGRVKQRNSGGSSSADLHIKTTATAAAAAVDTELNISS